MKFGVGAAAAWTDGVVVASERMVDDATTEDDAIVLLASDSAVHTTRAIACRCNTIKHILEDSSDEDTVIPLPAVDAATLRIVLLLLASHDEIDAVLGQDADELKLFCATSYLDSPHLFCVLQRKLVARLTTALSPRSTMAILATPRAGAHANDNVIVAFRKEFGVPVDLTAAEAAAGAGESPLTPEDTPAPNEACCRLSSLPGGDDLLDDLFSCCSRKVLSAAKTLSIGWRRAARRVMCRPSWQAEHLTVYELVDLGASSSVVCERLERPEGSEEAARRDIQTRAMPLHIAVMRATEAISAARLVGGSEAADAAAKRSYLVIEALLQAFPKGAEARDLEGFTPMHLACYGGAPVSILTMLLDNYPIVPWQKVWKVMALPRGGGGNTVPREWLELPEARNLGRLPLHCCAAGPAHTDPIRFLLTVYDQAAKETDAAGRTPLHLACMGNAPEESVELLLQAHHEAAEVVDLMGRIPLEHALETRPHDTRLLQLLATHSPRGAQLMLQFFMERLNLNASGVLMLAQQLAQEQSQRGAPPPQREPPDAVSRIEPDELKAASMI